jgi:hypothetical protein
VASNLGIDFSILRYKQEQSKLIGIHDLVYKGKYAAVVIRKEYNAKAFARLGALLDKAAKRKRK